MLEEHEKQFQASAESCGEAAGRKPKIGMVDSKQSASNKKTEQDSLRDNSAQKTAGSDAAQKKENVRVKE